jgi:circadian clock protein KaiC
MVSLDSKESTHSMARTGVPGLDHILGGGLARRRLFLVEGAPGSGKTTLALQFLLEGARSGESVLYVTLSETQEQLEASARSHGMDLSGVSFLELIPSANVLDGDDQYTMFHPSEVELAATTKAILAEVERINPKRMVIDSLSDVRLVAGNPLRYRRQVMAMKQGLVGQDCTLVLLDDMTAADHDLQVHSIAHGVILLEQLNPGYGSERRRLSVLKYRGLKFRGGYHDYLIQTGGLTVFPRLVAADHRMTVDRKDLATEVPGLDDLMGGGIKEGTSTLILGAAGSGKSTLAAQILTAAAGRGQAGAMFLFDESPATLIDRCRSVGVGLAGHVESGLVTLTQVDPAELSPGEFVSRIQHSVEHDGARLVVIDSLNGYLNAMPEERFLTIQLHELLTYLGQLNVATILIGSQHGLIGSQMAAPIDASYLADSVVLMRYFEHRGEVRQAISVMKKRGGLHERTIREFKMEGGELSVGNSLRDFRGILTGVPVYEGQEIIGHKGPT